MSAIHLITPEYPPHVGGVADYARQLARALAEAGEEVYVWCPDEGQGDPRDRFAVYPELGRFRAHDLERAEKHLDRFARPRRLLVQWVPHAYGMRSMNVGFCLWLWKRARGGDQIELMVHEPYLAFWEGTWRQTVVAAVHRLMTIILLRSARRVWFSIPAWEPMWKPYALGRSVPFAWLPIPSSVGPADPGRVAAMRSKLGAKSKCVAGTFGTYGSLIRPLLFGVLPEILRQADAPHVKLIGAGSLEFLNAFVERYPDHRAAVSATGLVSDADLAAHISACDLLIEPYPDGISSRRSSAMGGLSLGIPLVTTLGRLSEPFWSDSGSVRLSDAGNDRALAAQAMDLVRHPEERKRLGEAGRALYRRMFDMSRTVDAIRGAGPGKAA